MPGCDCRALPVGYRWVGRPGSLLNAPMVHLLRRSENDRFAGFSGSDADVKECETGGVRDHDATIYMLETV